MTTESITEDGLADRLDMMHDDGRVTENPFFKQILMTLNDYPKMLQEIKDLRFSGQLILEAHKRTVAELKLKIEELTEQLKQSEATSQMRLESSDSLYAENIKLKEIESRVEDLIKNLDDYDYGSLCAMVERLKGDSTNAQ